jgi:hypothetical protein
MPLLLLPACALALGYAADWILGKETFIAPDPSPNAEEIGANF